MATATKSKLWILWLVLLLLSLGWTAACGLALFYPTTGAVAQLTFHEHYRDHWATKADELSRKSAPPTERLSAVENANEFSELARNDRESIVSVGSAGGGGIVVGGLLLFLTMRARPRQLATA